MTISPPSVDIKDMLVDEGVGTFGSTAAWGLYISRRIDYQTSNADEAIFIYDSGEFDPDPKWNLDYPTVRILVRGNKTDYVGAYQKCELIAKFLLGRTAETKNNSIYVSIQQVGEINFIHRDDNNRPIFSMNFQCVREPQDTGNRLNLG